MDIKTPVYLSQGPPAQSNQLYAMLNAELKLVVGEILAAVDSEDNQNMFFFLEAPGGCGKTFLYSCITEVIRSRGEVALSAAWTGIAALLLPEGRTVHKIFGLPVPLTEITVSCIKASSQEADTLRKASIIIIDKASMIPALAVNCIDRLLRDIMGSVKEMGGKVIVFGGDFRQVLPVVPRGGKVTIISSCIQACKMWPKIRIMHLTVNMRTKPSEKLFAAWLLKLGNNHIHSEAGNDLIRIPDNFICNDNSLISYVFGNSIENNGTAHYNKAIVCPFNDDCRIINDDILELLGGQLKEYQSVDTLQSDEHENSMHIPIEYLHSISPSGMPPHTLRIKNGVVVMLIRNMNMGYGLVNGVRMIVRGMFENIIRLEIITGAAEGQIILLPRIDLISTDTNLPFSFKRRQFPLRLAFAMTINKAQAQTFDKLGIHLSRCVFTHGQLYVAFSRVKAAEDVKIKIVPTSCQGQFPNFDVYYTKNIVYSAVL